MNCVGCAYEKEPKTMSICASCARIDGGTSDFYTPPGTAWANLYEQNFPAARQDDNVNHPQHYKLDGLDIEVIDLIKSATVDKYEGYLLGNLIKYVMRYKKKNGVEDLKKAKVYLDWLIEGSERE